MNESMLLLKTRKIDDNQKHNEDKNNINIETPEIDQGKKEKPYGTNRTCYERMENFWMYSSMSKDEKIT